ncbi:DUF4123 domain-containing protein [Jannaschia marina]|uniref:DUF4123 domain-containing protein n=1 Tax=Jannaschia marina TaxID=2741674 RepID=UPI0015C6A499|nr:DUF4123 domain-containing protein [Jannaschia marina]
MSSISGLRPLPVDAPRGTQPDALRAHVPPEAPLFAVIDAGRFPNLPERLEAAGVAHRCLFQGRWAEDFGDVAPWLVRIDPKDDIFRALFTRSDRAWDHFDAYPGICLWSDAEIDDVSRHLRRLPRMLREDGSVLWFRYWETDILPLALRIEPAMVGPRAFGGVIDGWIAWGPEEAWVCLPGDELPAATGSMQLTPALMEAFSSHVRRHFWRGVERDFLAEDGLGADGFATFRSDVSFQGFRTAEGVTKLARLYNRAGRCLMSENWARACLSDTSALPEPIRVDRLVNAARDVGVIDIEAIV